MITATFAQELAAAWTKSWNDHDIEAVLEHYTDNIVLQTPMAALIVPESKGIIQGKTALRAYWTQALERIPDLHFEVINVLTGVNGVVIYYTNHANGRVAAEVLQLDEAGKVREAFVYYN
ncbi:nuclear transport factor 2 family protein [Chitinophagaceae bacterium MMS25-I14]